MKPDLITIDIESFWSQTHSLSKMSPIAYIMHPETEAISIAIKINEGETKVYFAGEIEPAIRRIDWSNALVVAHNGSGFDFPFLAWRYGVNPKLWVCTLAMARPWHMKDVGGSLKALTEHYGLGVKDSTALNNTKGRHFKDFTFDEVKAMRGYNKEDVELCYKLFKKLGKRTPPDELMLIDMTVRMLTEPQFEVDQELLRRTLKEEQERQQFMLLDIAQELGAYEIGQTEDETAEAARTMLASAAKFTEFLRGVGVDVPMKVSPSNPDKMIPALAKSDEDFLALQEHSNELVAAAASARLGVKSTILQTRIEKFLEAASYCDGRIPSPLKYYGAHTGRWSGEQYNMQNLPRVGKDKKPSDALRMSLMAPKGYKIVVADLSGIELRVNHFLWQVPSSMELFRADPEKADLYKDFASKLYSVEVDAVSKDQRQVGKVAHLGLGFGAGAVTFQKVAKLMGGVDLDEAESKLIVDTWRRAYMEIVKGWKSCQNALSHINMGVSQEVDPWGMCVTEAHGIKTPKGFIHYPNLRQENENGKTSWCFGEGRNKGYLTGPRVDENIVQHLARCIIADNMLDVKKEIGYIPASTTHDELIYVVPENEAENVLNIVQKIMRTPPKWWPELVTWSAGDMADRYGDAK